MENKMSINKNNIWNYIIYADDKQILFFDDNLELIEVIDRNKEENYGN